MLPIINPHDSLTVRTELLRTLRMNIYNFNRNPSFLSPLTGTILYKNSPLVQYDRLVRVELAFRAIKAVVVSVKDTLKIEFWCEVSII